MRVRRWVTDELYETEERGSDGFGHYEEEELMDYEIERAVKEYIRDNYTSKKDPKRMDTVNAIYEDLNRLTDIEELFKEEIAKQYDCELIMGEDMKQSIWHDATKELPEKSGDYVCFIRGYVSTIFYSKKYKAFNVADTSKSKATELKVEYWTTLKDLNIPGVKQ